jgi:hypothetical protein
MPALAMQSAFIVPVGWPIVVAAGMTVTAMVLRGRRRAGCRALLPVMSLYGMRLFGVLAVALLGGGFASIALAPGSVAASAWSTGAVRSNIRVCCHDAVACAARRAAGLCRFQSPEFVDSAQSIPVNDLWAFCCHSTKVRCRLLSLLRTAKAVRFIQREAEPGSTRHTCHRRSAGRRQRSRSWCRPRAFTNPACDTPSDMSH